MRELIKLPPEYLVEYEHLIQNKIGPNGHPVGYNKDGDKVEWLPNEEQHGGPPFPLILRRSDESIAAAYREYRDKVWWNDHQCTMRGLAAGEITITPENLAKAKEEAHRIEQQFGKPNLIFDDWNVGLQNGRMSALWWVLGAKWDGSPDI